MGEPVIRAEKIDLVQMVAEVVTGWEPEQGPTVLSESRCPRALVHADRFRTRQVLANLISNAAKHSPPKQAVRVVAGIEEGTCVVSVTDRGEGIPVPEGPDLRALLSGGEQRHAGDRRRGPRAVHRQAARRVDGGPDVGHVRGGAGIDVLLQPPARPTFPLPAIADS